MPATLQVLSYLVYGVLAAFVAVWLVLLIACLRKRRFWPIFAADRATKAFWLAALALLNPLLTLLYLVYGQIRRPDVPPGRIGPVQVGTAAIVVAIAGFFVNFPGLTHLWMAPFLGQDTGDAGAGDGRFRAHAAAIEARNGSSSTTVSTSGADCRVAFRRIAIVHGSDGPLAALVAKALRDEIVKLPFVENVQLCPDRRFPPSGAVRPDLFVLIDARDVHITPIPYAMGLSARIDVLAGTIPWHGVSSHNDGTDFPELEFSIHANVDHESRTVGYESVRHGLAASNIAEQIAGDLKKSLQGWLDRYGPMPELPQAFHGDFHPAELPPPLAEIPNEHIGSYSGLFIHNESIWRLAAPGGDLAELFGRLDAGMAVAGWKKISASPGDLLMDKGTVRIHIFKPSESGDTGWTIVTGKDAGAARRPVILYVHYRERFGPEERKAAIDGLLKSDAPLPSLILVRRWFDSAQRKILLDRLVSMRSPSAAAFLEAVEIQISEGLLDNAGESLRRARAALRAASKPDEFKQRIDEAAKRLADNAAEKAGLPRPAKAPDAQEPTADDFRSAGFHEVAAGGSPVEIEAGLDEPAALFQARPDGRLQTLAITVVPPAKGSPADACKVRFVETDVGMRSCGESGGSTRDGRWQIHHESSMGIAVDLVETDRKGRFHITARRSSPGE